MAKWLSIQAHPAQPVLVEPGQALAPPIPEMWALRVLKAPGQAEPDTTSITVQWDGKGDGEDAPKPHQDYWLVRNHVLRSTPVRTTLHEFTNVGPAGGRIVVQVDAHGGLVADLHYPTLPGAYRLDML